MSIMPMLEPRELEERRQHRLKSRQRKRRSYGVMPFILFVLVGYILVVAVMPVASLQVQTSTLDLPGKPTAELPWPKYGQAALGAVGYGSLAKHGDQKQLPIASMAKVITALAVLKERPIYKGKPMPMLTLTAADVATYKQYAAQDQSVVAVEAGEQLSEYQALQALLLPSANNMADVLVRWAFGTTDNYLKFANPFAKTLGMKNTNIVDASGFAPATTSTAEDLTKLAEIAMNTPIIAEIVGQPQADLPVAGTVYNVNNLVGHNGVVGIKTGNTDQAGGCYMFAVRRAVGGDRQVTLVGTIMGANNLAAAIDDAQPLIDAAFKLFHKTDVIHTSQIVGKISQTGGKTTSIVASRKLSITAWDSQVPKAEVTTNALGSSVKQADEVGRIDINVGDMSYTIPIIASETIRQPSLGWRIRHAAGYL